MVHRAAGATRGAGPRQNYAGWGGAQADSAPYGTAIQVAGREFAAGVGILSGSRMEVKNAGHASFRAFVGVDDETRNRAATVRFYVYGDGRLLAQSAPLGWGEDAVELSAPVAGVKIVELVTRNVGADKAPSSVAWGEARLTR
jgi:hypothetical protein